MTDDEPPTLVTADMIAARDVWSEPVRSWPVSATAIRRWAQAVYWPEVPPPIFWDEDYARGTVWGGIVAPHEFNPFAWPLEGAYGQETALAELHGEPEPAQPRVTAGRGTRGLNGGLAIRYVTRLRPGDVVSSTTALTSWSERETRLGLTLFSAYETRWSLPSGELVKVMTQTRLSYRPEGE
ncbi:MaoC family dehydratase N-terminal domain-containing protein [Microbacterium sp. X-17]|uniref:FAS1-like dehydratase domain-containing protein n=1 Tax=Microbacterium sp. X-17 TaxID=3144404 RepID=UPI0031F5A1B8